jgi:hypothetical protein
MAVRLLLWSGVLAGPLFVVALLVEGAARDGYDAMRHPGSSLALGPSGWTQTVNFLVAGLLTLAFAIGLRAVLRDAIWGPVLVGVWGVGLLGAAAFASDPVNGYPPGTPDRIAQSTVHGMLHDAFSVPGFLALLVACFVFMRWFATRGRRGLAIYSAVTGVVFAVSFALAGAAFNQAAALADIGGLCQRITVAAGFAWLTTLAVHLLREPAR